MSVLPPPLVQCPVCRHDLTGVQGTCRCPACGVELGTARRVWATPPLPSPGVAYVVFLCLMIPVVLWAVRQHQGANFLELFGLVLTLAVLTVGPLLWCFQQSRSFVAMTDGGLAYRLPLGQPRSVAWSEVYFHPEFPHPYELRDGRLKRLWLPVMLTGHRLRNEVYQTVRHVWETKAASDAVNRRMPPRCPCCTYDLAGLPRAHRCPECGFIYDETTAVFWEVYHPAEAVVTFTMTLALLVQILARLGLGTTFAFDGVLLICALVTVATFVKVRRGAPFIAVGQNALAYRGELGRTRQFQWSELSISKAPVSKAALRVTRLSRPGPKKLRLPKIRANPANLDTSIGHEIYRRWKSATSQEAARHTSHAA